MPSMSLSIGFMLTLNKPGVYMVHKPGPIWKPWTNIRRAVTRTYSDKADLDPMDKPMPYTYIMPKSTLFQNVGWTAFKDKSFKLDYDWDRKPMEEA